MKWVNKKLRHLHAGGGGGGGKVPKWADTYQIKRGKANMLGLAGEKHNTGLVRGAANQIW
jgi:hypothetical protein